MTNKKYFFIIMIFLIVSSLAVFGRIAGNDFISIDDRGYISQNPNIQSGFNLHSIKWALTTSYFTYWHPLTWLSHMLDWQLWGANASGHHVVSLFLHIGAVILLFLFLYKTTNSVWPSAFGAAFFALHPLRVESVAWASERKDVLSMFFGLASIYTYSFYTEKSKLSRYILCLVLFVLALMSKPVMITLPFILMLLDYWPLQRWQKALNASRPNKLSPVYKLILEKIPFIALSIISSIITFWAQNKVEAVASFPMTVRVANAITSYPAYLGKIFLPRNLAVFYPYDFTLPLWKVIISSFILIVITITVIYSMKKTPFFFTGWFWYLGTFVPLIGLVQAGGHAMTDRHTYLPSIGIAIILAWGFPALVKNRDIRKKILLPAGIVIITILAILSWRQCGYWKNSINLFSHTLMVTNNNDRIHANLGLVFFEKGNFNRAIYHFDKAIRIVPYYEGYYMSRAQVYAKAGIYQKAIDDYDIAIKLKSNYADAYNNRAIVYFKLEKIKSGCMDAQKACELGICRALDSAKNQGLCN